MTKADAHRPPLPKLRRMAALTGQQSRAESIRSQEFHLPKRIVATGAPLAVLQHGPMTLAAFKNRRQTGHLLRSQLRGRCLIAQRRRRNKPHGKRQQVE